MLLPCSLTLLHNEFRVDSLLLVSVTIYKHYLDETEYKQNHFHSTNMETDTKAYKGRDPFGYISYISFSSIH